MDRKPDTLDVLQFTCPKCGGHEFEQNVMLETPEDPKSGLCHGYTIDGACRFRFKADDPRYFKPTGETIPRIVVASCAR